MSTGNLNETWQSLQKKTEEAIGSYFPVEGRGKKLVLHKLQFDENQAAHDDIRSQEAAKDLKQTWGVPVYGEVGLVDKATGKEVDRAKIKLLTLPKPTNRYSYIVDGSEWQIDNLWRLRSGVYAHIKQNGELATEFNLAKPFVREPRIHIPFDPESRKFKFKWKTSNMSLYSVLKMMGVSDEDMKKTWGPEIYRANAIPENRTKEEISKLYEKTAKRGVKAPSNDYDGHATALLHEFDKTRLLPDITKAVLGKPFDRVNGEALLLASERILKVARGDVKPDDRDSLIFKNLVGVDDFLHDRLTGFKTQKTVLSRIGNNIDRQKKVRDILSGDIFNRPVKEFFTTSALSRNPEQVNPLEMIGNHRSTTIMGGDEGGIKNEQAIVQSMRLINPSHFGFLDPIHTPESEKTGITLNLPLGVKKVGNDPVIPVYDLKEHKLTHATPAELHSSHVVLPDQVTWGDDAKPKPISAKVKMKDPKTQEILERPFSEARYIIPSPHQLFDEASNLIPFLQNDQGNRTSMADRQVVQAMSLHHREEPLVQTQSGGKLSWEKVIGIPWSHASTVDGKVVDIVHSKANGYPESVIIQGSDGKKHEVQLYNHFPLNDAKTMMHSTPLVKVGDEVKKGQVVADSNFTKNGHLALGTNLRVGYMVYKGYNYNDGVVISESAAKKLTSEHLHRKTVEINPEKDEISKQRFTAYASTMSKQLSKAQMDKLGPDGVVHVGQRVEPGDILVAAVGKRDLAGEAARMVGRLSKKSFNFTDKSVSWDSDYPGEVVKVVKEPNGKGATVYVRTLEPAVVGDKMVGRYGNKGIITRIVPDHEMPRIGGADGTHIEVLMNPSGVPSRINLGQILETAASKIAEKTGKPYLTKNFAGPHVDYTQQVKDDLKAHGLKDTEEVYDPTTQKKLGDILTGKQYILKLKHQVEKKLSVRAHSQNYTLDHAPGGTGSDHPGQGLGQLEFYALLAHGARHNLREMATYKADQHLGEHLDPMSHIDFWDRVRTGMPLPAPTPTFAYKKFEALLTGLGVNIHKEGNELHLMPLTDKGVLALSHGEIKDGGRVLRGKDAKELEKGLFDPKVTGGLPNDKGKGLFWSHIALAEPVPNPIFVGKKQTPGPAVVLTGLTFDEFENIAKGKKEVNGKTGGPAIMELLKKIDVQKELKDTFKQLPNLRGSELNQANRKAKYLLALDKLGMKPHEAYMMQHVPVLPPVFRPIVPMPDGSLRFDDVNQYYRSIALISDKLKNPVKELGGLNEAPLREQLYDATMALSGLGGHPIYESNRKMKGILDVVVGDQPKEGYFQKKLMKRRQELSMRSTIIPEPAMHLDHVGLPKDAAMELYKPFVVRELKMLGYNPMQALREIKEGKEIAWKALSQAMDKRPILFKRDPALHKFSIMAFKPRIVEGKAIQIHPLVTGGYNADFDGDTMSVFVPLTEEAVKEAHKMFPSNNLFSPTNFDIVHTPDQEGLLGLHLMSKWGKSTGKSFSTFADAQKAFERGAIRMDDVIKMNGKETTFGRLSIVRALPEEHRKDDGILHDPKFIFNKKTLPDFLGNLARKDPKNFAVTVDLLKDMANEHSYRCGFSFSLKDFDPPKQLRDSILKKYDSQADKIRASSLSQTDKDQKLVELYTQATEELDKAVISHFAAKGDNNLHTMVFSGARGNKAQFRQMASAPMLMKDGTGRTIPTPIKKSYSEGLDVGDYWTTLHAARMGTLQRVQGTSEPGRMTKEIVNVSMPNMIVSRDCGTSNGISMHIDDPDVHDRFLAAAVKLPTGKTLEEGELITPDVTALLKKHKIEKVVVRSPLKCSHGHGLCAACYGLNENGELHEVGTNIGVIAGQAMGEPATQLTMDSFHTGGVAASRGGASVDKFTRLNQLIEVPKILPGAGTLSRVSGKVTKVEKDPATNGHYIHIGGEKHFAPSYRQVAVKPGVEVKKGELLTDGHINPHELLKLTDIHAVQNYLSDQLYNAVYKDERVRRRNIETVVRNLTNLTQIKDPGDSDYIHGDIALRTVVEEHNKKLGPHETPIHHEPLLRGAAQVALDQHEDWMARLNFQRLRQTILEGTAKGWVTNLHGTNPVPAYAFGSEFGKGTKDKPHLY